MKQAVYVVVVHHFDEETFKLKKSEVIRKAFPTWNDAKAEEDRQFEKNNYECGCQIIPLDIVR